METNLPLVYLNMVGGQDDQVFDGGSFVLNPGGKLAVQLPFFEEYKETIKFVRKDSGWIAETGKRVYQPSELEKGLSILIGYFLQLFQQEGF